MNNIYEFHFMIKLLNSYLVNISLRVYLADVSFLSLYNEDIYESFIYFIYKTRNL